MWGGMFNVMMEIKVGYDEDDMRLFSCQYLLNGYNQEEYSWNSLWAL